MIRLTREWWKSFILLASSVCVALWLGELSIATFFPQSLGTWGMTRDGITSHVPNLAVYDTRFNQLIKTNSHGMRDREHPLAKEKGVFRILILGDSFMEANQVAFEDSLPHLLEADFGRPVEVVNASVSGWGTDDELTYLLRYGFQFNPDLILLGMTLHNDLQDNLDEEFHSFENGVLREKPKGDMPVQDYVILRVKEFFASHSNLYQMLLRAKRFSWAKQAGNRLSSHVASLLSKESNEEVARGWDMTRHLLRKMRMEIEGHGARLVVFMIPLWVQVSDERLRGFLSEHKMSMDQIVLDQPQLKMKTIAEQEGIEIIDLLPDFRRAEKQNPKSLYLMGDGHWTAMGHRIAATLVETQLRSKGVIP